MPEEAPGRDRPDGQTRRVQAQRWPAGFLPETWANQLTLLAQGNFSHRAVAQTEVDVLGLLGGPQNWHLSLKKSLNSHKDNRR